MPAVKTRRVCSVHRQPSVLVLFKPSAQLARCDECRSYFDPVYGGVCVRCKRLLCATHLHGGFLQRLVGRLVPRQSECVQCRGRSALS